MRSFETHIHKDFTLYTFFLTLLFYILSLKLSSHALSFFTNKITIIFIVSQSTLINNNINWKFFVEPKRIFPTIDKLLLITQESFTYFSVCLNNFFLQSHVSLHFLAHILVMKLFTGYWFLLVFGFFSDSYDLWKWFFGHISSGVFLYNIYVCELYVIV